MRPPGPALAAQSDWTAYLGFICGVAALGGFLFGFDQVVVSGAIDGIRSHFGLSPAREGLFVSVSLFGALIGSGVAGLSCDLAGRRPVLLAAGVLTTLSGLGCAFAADFNLLLAARFVGGLGVGAASMACPLFISEISPPRHRGRLISLFQFAITLGICGAVFSNAAIARAAGGHLQMAHFDLWRVMLATQMAPSLIFLLLSAFLPESPRWLVRAGRPGEAERLLIKTQGAAVARSILNDVEGALAIEMREGRRNILDLLKPGVRRSLGIALFLAFMSEMSGITVVFYYGPTILARAGLTLGGSLDGFATIGLVNMLSTLIALWLIDRAGRRPLLLVGTAGAVLSLIGIGLCLSGGPGVVMPSGAILVGLICAFVFFFAFGIGPIKFVVASEIFPNRLRGQAVALSTVVVWLTGAVVNQAFPILREAYSPALVFFIFGAVLTPQILFALTVLPETANRTLEDIELSWGTTK